MSLFRRIGPFAISPVHRRSFSAVSRNSGISSKVFIRSAITLGLTSLGLLAFIKYEKGKAEKMAESTKETAIGSAQIGGPFTLLDHNGRIVTEQDFKGKFLLIYFGFTHCPDICPEELEKMSDALKILEKDARFNDKIVPLFITVDPRRDSGDILRSYVKGPNMATDSHKKELSEKDDYLVDHSVFIYLMGPDGNFADLFGSDKKSSEIAESIKKRILNQEK